MSHRVGAVSPDTRPRVALVHVPLTPRPLPARAAGAGEVTRGGLGAGAPVHAGQGLALGNVCLTEVTLVTRGTRAAEGGQAAGAEATVLTRGVSTQVCGHTGLTRVARQTDAGHVLPCDLAPGVGWAPGGLTPGLRSDLAPLSLVARGAGAGGGLTSHTGAAIQTEAGLGQTRVTNLECKMIKIEILLRASPRFWSHSHSPRILILIAGRIFGP